MKLHFLVTAALLVTPVFAVADEAAQPEETHGLVESEGLTGQKMMVAAAHPLATQAGFDVLQAGGSAIDAAVAVQFMLNLVEPQSSGIGGGAFMLYWDAETQSLTTFDGREKAPLLADESYFLNEDGEPVGWWDAVIGGRSVGVPGTLKLLETVHDRYGKTEWASLIAPTIQTAEEGFEVSPRMAASIAGAAEKGLDKFEAARTYFFDQAGAPLSEGTLLKNPAFAETLSAIADKGSAAFYEGALAQAIVDAVAATEDNPGIMSLEDLASYEVIEREPVCSWYRLHKVCGMGPPTSGGLTVAQILGMLEIFDLPGMGYTADSAHLFLEAGRLAYADRGLYMADADFVDMPTKGLIDPYYVGSRAALIREDASMGKASPGEPPHDEAMLFSPDTQKERPGTSHFVIVDAAGNAVSMTTTIETGFGSRVMVGGFLLNNELTDFSRAPEKDGIKIANRVEGGKRPRSSMSPTMVLKGGKPYILTGSPGGSRIINYVAQSLVAMIDWGMSPQEAAAMGHFVNRNGATDLEEGTDAVKLEGPLLELGHEVNIRNLNSGLHIIKIEPDGTLHGGADPRREGIVLAE